MERRFHMKEFDKGGSDSDSSGIQITRRSFMQILGASVGIAALGPTVLVQDVRAASGSGNNGAVRYVYVGTYTAPNFAPGGKSASTAKGIYAFRMDVATGNLTLIQTMETENPSFLAVHPELHCLYSVNELGTDDHGKPMGRVSAFKIDPSSGQLSFLNSHLTEGTWPCHVSLHPSGKYLFAANYGTGNFPVFPILEDGRIGKMTFSFQGKGNGAGPDGTRQEGPHSHMILTNPGGQHVFGIDLGADQLLTFDFDTVTGELTPGSVPYAGVVSGGGCRHMAFHPGDKFAYVLNELSSSIDVFDFNASRGSFICIQSLSTLPEDTEYKRPEFDASNPGKVPTGTNTTAEIRVHPSGKWLYSTNRGMDSIAVFAVEAASGKLSSKGWVPTQGEIPRGMNIDPSGTYLYVGNQNSDNIAVFRINADEGILEGPVQTLKCPVPVDFAFGPMS